MKLDNSKLFPYIDAIYNRLSSYPLDRITFVRKDEYTILVKTSHVPHGCTRETWGELVIDLNLSLTGQLGIVTRICGGHQLPQAQGTVSPQELDANRAWCKSMIRLIEALRLALDVSKMIQRETTKETP